VVILWSQRKIISYPLFVAAFVRRDFANDSVGFLLILRRGHRQ
jgi:hypothetical protein